MAFIQLFTQKTFMVCVFPDFQISVDAKDSKAHNEVLKDFWLLKQERRL